VNKVHSVHSGLCQIFSQESDGDCWWWQWIDYDDDYDDILEFTLHKMILIRFYWSY